LGASDLVEGGTVRRGSEPAGDERHGLREEGAEAVQLVTDARIARGVDEAEGENARSGLDDGIDEVLGGEPGPDVGNAPSLRGSRGGDEHGAQLVDLAGRGADDDTRRGQW
jgi:hypothetical protein